MNEPLMKPSNTSTNP